jgi:hypothetical protein
VPVNHPNLTLLLGNYKDKSVLTFIIQEYMCEAAYCGAANQTLTLALTV